MAERGAKYPVISEPEPSLLMLYSEANAFICKWDLGQDWFHPSGWWASIMDITFGIRGWVMGKYLNYSSVWFWSLSVLFSVEFIHTCLTRSSCVEAKPDGAPSMMHGVAPSKVCLITIIYWGILLIVWYFLVYAASYVPTAISRKRAWLQTTTFRTQSCRLGLEVPLCRWIKTNRDPKS